MAEIIIENGIIEIPLKPITATFPFGIPVFGFAEVQSAAALGANKK
jgi:hypothetical protein